MRLVLLCLMGWAAWAPIVRASETLGDGARAIVNEENDKFVKPSTDKHYSQGLQLTVLWPDDRIPFWGHPLSWLPVLGVEQPVSKYGFRVGQNIYTPEDTKTRTLIRDDRPYAGWLFLGLTRENRGALANGLPTLDRFTLDTGVIGPWAQADNSQMWFHHLIEVEQPKGWRNQLKNEPGLLLAFDRKVLLWDSAPPDEPFRLQLLPHAGIRLGNIETSALLGATVRLGYNFPNEFAKSSPARLGWNLFSGLEARAVAYNAFLDGNLFRDSHHVAKEPVVLRFRLGCTFILYRAEFTYIYNFLTNEFKKQDKYDTYGTLNLTYHF